MMSATQKVIAIGASTGGIDALEKILVRLPPSVPPVVIVVHLQPGIARLFANQLDDSLKLSVKEAEAGDQLKQGHVFIAPSGKHMKINNKLGKLVIECFNAPKVQHVIPSADVLFESVADEVRKNAIGVLLTGIGADGARGLLRMRAQGAPTIGQNEATCTVYGMPKVAKEMGAVDYELPLNQIADKILSLL